MEPEGRLPNRKISETMRNITMSDDFTGIKSIHAIRRTVNSRLRNSGVSVMIASSLLGHTELVNNQNYTYDLTNLQQKKVAIEGIVTTSNQKENIRNAEN
jgi:integrase